MSGYDPSDNTYIQTWDDAYYVFFWVVVFTGARAATMDFVLKPFAEWGGIQTKKGRTRFAEQGWLFVYYSGFWTLGMVSRNAFLHSNLERTDLPPLVFLPTTSSQALYSSAVTASTKQKAGM